MNALRPSVLFGICMLGSTLAGSGQTTWDAGGGSDLTWSALGNWSTDASPANTAVEFGLAGATANASTISNIVDTGFSINSLTYNLNGAGAWQVTQIAAGQTLAVESGSFFVGAGVSGGITSVAIRGGGSLAINSPSSSFTVTNAVTDVSSSVGSATLDMSGLATFSANVNAFNVGTGSLGNGTIYLAASNTITANTFLMGGGSGNVTSGNVLNKVFLGTSNIIHADSIRIGDGQTGGQFQFQTGLANASLTLRAKDGLGRTDLAIGDFANANAAKKTYGTTVDLRGGSVDALLDDVIIGRVGPTGQLKVGRQVSFLMDAGSVDARTVNVAQSLTANTTTPNTLSGTLGIGGGSFSAETINLASSSGGGTNVNGFLNVSGAQTEVTVTGNITAGLRAAGATGSVNATINVSAGTLIVGGNLSEGSADANSIVNLNGGRLDMTNGSIAVNAFNFTGGVLENVSSFSATVSGGLAVQNAATLSFTSINGTFSSMALTGNLTLNSAGANLSLSLADGFVPLGDLLLIANDGTDAITGSFASINGGAFGTGNTFTLSNNTGTYEFALRYTGGDGNDLTAILTIPEPSTYALLALGIGVLILARRKLQAAG